jgi:hypothetical protein
VRENGNRTVQREAVKQTWSWNKRDQEHVSSTEEAIRRAGVSHGECEMNVSLASGVTFKEELFIQTEMLKTRNRKFIPRTPSIREKDTNACSVYISCRKCRPVEQEYTT